MESPVILKNGNGFAKIGGIIIQWGTTSVPGSTDLTISFPTPFLYNCCSVVATMKNSSRDNPEHAVDVFTTRSFALRNKKGGARTYCWFAIGY